MYIPDDAALLTVPNMSLVPYDIPPSGVPESFSDCLRFVPLLMSGDIGFEGVYMDTALRSKVPVLTPCVVDCRPTWCGETENRVIAFAVRENGHLRWYGVNGSDQDPAELAGVKRYVPVSEVIDECLRIGHLNGTWT